MHFGLPGSSYDLGGHKHELSTPRSLNEKSGHVSHLSIVPLHVAHRYEHSIHISNHHYLNKLDLRILFLNVHPCKHIY